MCDSLNPPTVRNQITNTTYGPWSWMFPAFDIADWILLAPFYQLKESETVEM